MSFIFDDNFDGYTIGDITPFGGWLPNNGNGSIIADPPAFNALYTDPSIASSVLCCLVSGGIRTFYAPIASGYLTFSIFISPNGSISAARVCSLINGPTSGPGNTFSLLGIEIEPDLTLSLVTDAGVLIDATTSLPCNTGVDPNNLGDTGFVLQIGRWYMVTLQFSFRLAGDGITVLSSGSLGVDGLGLFGGELSSGHIILPPNGIFTASAQVNSLGFIALNGFTPICIDNVTLSATPGWPHPATPPAPLAEVSQFAFEYAGEPVPKGRISQMVVEQAALPLRKARVSQLVVEVMRQNTGPVNPQGWLVKES